MCLLLPANNKFTCIDLVEFIYRKVLSGNYSNFYRLAMRISQICAGEGGHTPSSLPSIGDFDCIHICISFICIKNSNFLQ